MNIETANTKTIGALRDFLDSLEEGVVFLDAHRRVVDLNTAAERLLGASHRAIVDQLCPSLFPHTECARQCEARGECSLTPERGETRKVQDIVLRRPDGAETALRMWALLMPRNESGLYCSIILRDCTRERSLEALSRDRWALGGLVGRSPAMQALYATLLRIATSDASVLITGESGVGKELVARALHDNSPRANGPYVPLHCAALPENLLESELFGHAKGAFSGAGVARMGRFEAANGGTLLLDEIGEISPAMQTKLLRVLQEREIVRLGENHARHVDVRVLAATHRDLAAMVARGEFREDLYYRLRVLPLHVPALRERRDDIPLLVTKLLADLAQRYRRPRLQVAADAMAALEAYAWPGNVRQLSNALEYAVVNSDGELIVRSDLLPEILNEGAAATSSGPAMSPLRRYYQAPGDANERDVIRRVLQEAGGNKAEAARRLGMSRTTLWKRLKLK